MWWGTSGILPRSSRWEAFSSGQSEAQAVLQDESSKCQGIAPGQQAAVGTFATVPTNAGEGVSKMHLLLELCLHPQSVNNLFAPAYLTLSPLCLQTDILHTASWGRDTLSPAHGAIGQGVWMLSRAGHLAVQLLNSAGTDLEQFYNCVWGTKFVVGFDQNIRSINHLSSPLYLSRQKKWVILAGKGKHLLLTVSTKRAEKLHIFSSCYSNLLPWAPEKTRQ